MPGILIGTQHPAFGGGVLTLVRAFLDWVRSRPQLNPQLAYATLARNDPANLTLREALRGCLRPRLREERWEDLPAYCVGKLLPGIEALSNCGVQPLWRRVLTPFDVHQVVCGYAVTGMPQALSGKRYVVWVASSMDGDKGARLKHGGFSRRVAQRLQRRALVRQERLVLERAAWVLALSPRTEVELHERGADPRRMSCLACPVDVLRFVPPPAPSVRPAVLWVTRLNDPRKNTTLLLHAFAKIAPSCPDATLILAGEGDPAALRRIAEDCGVRERVEFTGRLADADLPKLYGRASVFAIPSEQEGLCIAGLEAMACGVPVVSTRCGGPEAFVIPGQTGLLVDVADEEQMADALRQLLNDQVRCHEMGRRARRLIEEQFSPASFARQLDRVYSAVWPEHFGTAS